MEHMDHEANLEAIFQSLDADTFRLSAREASSVEFKETFNWGSRDRYARTIASFANNRGGYLIFGVSNNPRIFNGLQTQNFENLDEADITAYLNSLFSPEIEYEKFVFQKQGRRAGIIYIHKANDKPIIAVRNDGTNIKEAEIYYRYNGRTDKIRYPELKALFQFAQEKERNSWVALFEKVSKIGPSSTAVMDVVNGTIEGEKNSLLIDQSLIPKLKFIKEGQFTEKGKPTLKLVGDVRPIAVTGYRRGGGELRITDDPNAPAVREETVLKGFPLSFKDLTEELSNRYSDFKANPRFYEIKKALMKDQKYSRTRYLNHKTQKGIKQDFYSKVIIKEFDKHYTKK
jgi:hypothetical protein